MAVQNELLCSATDLPTHPRSLADLWLPTRRAVAQPRLRLLCFPFAGGGAVIFHTWSDAFPADIEVRAVQLPARQNRLHEPGLESVAAIVARVSEALDTLPPAPLALYGHSFGSILAYETARSRGASRLIVAARKAPDAPAGERIADLSPQTLLERIRQLYDAPTALLHEPDLQALVLPSLRADMRALERYVWEPPPLVSVPVTVLGGTRDACVSEAELQAWRAHTTGPVDVHLVEAGHRFVETHRAWVIERVRASLCC